MRKAVILLLFWVGIAHAAHAARPDFAPVDLAIETHKGIVSFRGDLAQTPEEIAYGLMFRTDIADDYAMLFDLGSVRQAGFWMKNTLIPLDMIFISPNGRIDSILTDVPPLSLQTRKSQGKVRWVIEVKGGIVAEHGIAVGDKVKSAAMF